MAGCASREPIRLDGQLARSDDIPGVLWTYATYKKKLFERLNYATVTEIDGKKFGRFPAPVELVPGKHQVQVKYSKDSFLCGYFGCIVFEQATSRLELGVESDHGYLPLAGNYCGKDWIWIVDLGSSARQQIDAWRVQGALPYSVYLHAHNLDLATLKVVAGEAPPELCKPEQE